uniref:Cadherin-related family member 5 n=1 Tax=Oryzias latipes TaxID=8090 RepID=A0A3P9LP17_ORYLA
MGFEGITGHYGKSSTCALSNPGMALLVPSLFSSLLLLLSLHTAAGMSGWAGCLDGEDVFAAIKENSLSGDIVSELAVDTTTEGVQWSLVGKDADWFLLDGKNIRLNASADKILDRESLGPILTAELLCNEENVLQSINRIIVKILNENDNSPVFENKEQTLFISELTKVNTVVFTVRATDADNDKIIYAIDQTSPNAEYFKIDLPNSGGVILSKPLDFETKPLLTVTVFASEMNTAERYNTSISITIHVLDGDDQYPQFEPCMLLFQDEKSQICTSPVYTTNVTEGQEDIVLDFFPAPIHAVDGDRGLSSPISYAILPGDDEDHFKMDRKTGVIRLTQGVTDRLMTPVLRLQVMAFQDDDPMKYSVATVLVRIIAENQFYPEFDMPEYRGFVIAGKSPVSLVNTYGSKALILHVRDQDFRQGFNPMIDFSFSPTSNYTDIYQVTHGGLLIAKACHLKPKQKHVLEIMAVDQESGDATFATVVVEVLSEGQSIPHHPLGDDRLTGCTVGKALFLSTMFLTVLGCVLLMLMWLKKKHRGMKGPLERGCVAQCKHPNVVSHGSAMPHMEDVHHNNAEGGTCNPSFSFLDKPNTDRDTSPSREPVSAKTTVSFDITVIPIETVSVSLNNNAGSPNKMSSPTFHIEKEELSTTREAQEAPPKDESPGSPSGGTTEATETEFNRSLKPVNQDGTETLPDSQAGANLDDLVTSPPSPFSNPCSQAQSSLEESDDLVQKSCLAIDDQTSPYSEVTDSSPPTPEHGPLKAVLVHIDTTPTNTPPETPEATAKAMYPGDDQPCTSLDQGEPSDCVEESADTESPCQDKITSENIQDVRKEKDEQDGCLGHGDADQNRESEGELESDEEELLRLMMRCNPIFITFSK